MELKNIIDPKGIRGLSLSVFYYISGTIIGPLILFAGSGLLLDKYFNTKPVMLIAGVFLAFIITNILLFRKVKEINSLVNRYVPEESKGNVSEEKKLKLGPEEIKEDPAG